MDLRTITVSFTCIAVVCCGLASVYWILSCMAITGVIVKERGVLFEKDGDTYVLDTVVPEGATHAIVYFGDPPPREPTVLFYRKGTGGVCMLSGLMSALAAYLASQQ